MGEVKNPSYYEKVSESADFIRGKFKDLPEIAIILGSGLGPLVDEIENGIEIEYRDIPHFPMTTVEGHSGKLVGGKLGGRDILAMKGRFHYYEGHEISNIVFHIRVFKLLGINNILVTNAAGGINSSFKPGDLMIIRDHISFFAPSPLRGSDFKEFGVRFPDMTEAYTSSLIEMAKKSAQANNINIQVGVYAFAQGPMYETPAEIKALKILGADAVGMSTVPEVITARHSGMKVLGISCITNMAAGILGQTLNHEEVMKTAKEVEVNFTKLVKTMITNWDAK